MITNLHLIADPGTYSQLRFEDKAVKEHLSAV